MLYFYRNSTQSVLKEKKGTCWIQQRQLSARFSRILHCKVYIAMSTKVSPSKFNVITSQKVRTVFRTVRVVCFTLLMTKTINTALLRGKTYKQL